MIDSGRLTLAEIEARLDRVIEELEDGETVHQVVRQHWREALSSGWLTRLRTCLWAFDSGTADHALLDRLTPYLDYEARRLPGERP